MFKNIQKLPTISKVKVISAICCIFVCVGIICVYSIMDTSLLDSISYYDKEMNFHYYHGLEKLIMCILSIAVLSIILIMRRLIEKYMCPNNERRESTRFIILTICIFLYGVFIYGIFDLNIGHIIITENNFYSIDNLIIKSNFEEYPYSYFDNHVVELSEDDVYFCKIDNNAEYTKWERELLVGRYSDNIYLLLNELDNRTDSKYQITNKFDESKSGDQNVIYD